MSNGMLQPGFVEPVADAQSCFRAVLDAVARPGQVHSAGTGLTPPDVLAPATAAVLLTLLDYDTPLWIDAPATAARDWIAFHCGAPVVATPATCSFALALSLPDIAALSVGTHEAPESSATLILQVAALDRGTRYRLRGPGLRDSAELLVDGLPLHFVTAWQANNSLFPRGIDIVLCAGTSLAALPRSVTLQEA